MLKASYVVGLVDGEGSFTVYVKRPGRLDQIKRRVRVEPKFYLKLVARDRRILHQLQKFFGCGSVYFQKERRVNHQDCYRYEVFRRDDLITVIIPFFQKHPPQLASKKHDFQVFCQLMRLISRGEHLTVRGWRRIYRLAQKLH